MGPAFLLAFVAADADASGDAPSKLLPVASAGVRFSAGPPAPGWTQPEFDDSAWGGPVAGPFGPGAVGVSPGASLLLRKRFDVPDVARARAIELAISYADGFVAHINGREVARRSLPEGEAEDEPALAPHGSEVERIYLPVRRGFLRGSGNVLAVQIRAASRAPLGPPSGPAGSVDLAVVSGVRIVRGPYLVSPGEREIRVAWETDLPSRGRVEASDATGRARRASSGGRNLRHVVRLAALRPGTRYTYTVLAEGERGDAAVSAPVAFATPPARPGPLRFAVYGDMRAPGHEAHAAVVAALVKEAPTFVLNTGDLVNRGSEESDWQRHFGITAPLGARAAIVPALGNHDAFRSGGAEKTWDLFAMPRAAGAKAGFTSFDIAGVHFVILDSNRWRAGDQKIWLERALVAIRRRRPRAIFAFCHDGPVSHGFHGGNADALRDYAPLLARAGVDVLFSGHDHLYERGVIPVEGTAGFTYVVSGGGGAPLYNPTCRPPGQPAAAGVPGPLPACPPTVAALEKIHHYVIVEVGAAGISMCPRRIDGAPVEPCLTFPPQTR